MRASSARSRPSAFVAREQGKERGTRRAPSPAKRSQDLMTSCPICLESMTDAVLLPGCGHSFCANCVDSLPRSTTRCPLCRVAFTRGTQVPNWSLRDAVSNPPVEGDSASANPETMAPAAPAALIPPSAPSRPRTAPNMSGLAGLGIPSGLARIAADEAARVGLRLFLLDNSGSTMATDGHELRGGRILTCTRWREIVCAAESAASLGVATGVPCEFHLLNPFRGHAASGAGTEGDDFIRTQSRDDLPRLAAFLKRVNPSGVTPLAERLRSLRPHLDAFAASEGSSGRVAFMVIVTDGAPTPMHSGTPTDAAARAALAALRQLVSSYSVRLVVRLCTDEESAVSFWNEADSELELPRDVLDDFAGEAKEVHAHGNGWLCYSPALHLLRESGTLIGLLDLLDERTLSPGESAVLAGLLLECDTLPDWKHDRAEFAAAVTARAAAAGQALDGRRRRMAPLVDARALLRAVHGPGLGERIAYIAGPLLVLLAAWWIATSPEQDETFGGGSRTDWD